MTLILASDILQETTVFFFKDRRNITYIPSCTVAKVNVDAFGDDVLSVPECGDMTEKNQIQESLSRYSLL